MRGALLLATLLLSGCTVTRRLAPLPAAPPGAERLPVQVELVVQIPWFLFSSLGEERLRRCTPASVEAALRASERFEFDRFRVGSRDALALLLLFPFVLLDPPDPRTATLDLELRLSTGTRHHLLGLLTLGLFPRYQEDHLALSGTLRAPGGRVLAQVERHERLGTLSSNFISARATWKFGEEQVDQALSALVHDVAAALVDPCASGRARD